MHYVYICDIQIVSLQLLIYIIQGLIPNQFYILMWQ